MLSLLRRRKSIKSRPDLSKDGTTRWTTKMGKIHRDDGPTVISPDGSLLWYQEDRKHRDNGPASLDSRGYKSWFLNGTRHREDGPALIHPSGHQIWYQNGKRHRLDGPAVINPDGSVEYWVHGESVSYLEWLSKVLDSLSR